MKQAKQIQIRRFVGRRMQAKAASRRQQQSLLIILAQSSRSSCVDYLLSKLLVFFVSFMASAQAVSVFLLFH
jgi:hypothetical protein